MPFLSTPRGRFFYRQAAGDQPVLVFLHGNLGTSLWWRPVLDLLPVGWYGLAFDAIGYGHSDRTERLDRFSLAALALDLAGCLDALGLAFCHLVAHSSATPVAVEFALAYPGRVATLAMVGPVPVSGVSTPAEAYPLLERLPQDHELLAQALHASAPALDPASAEFRQYLADAGKIDGMTLVASARSLDAWAPGERLRQLTLPVLLMRGEDDLMVSEQEAQQTLLAIPGANNLEVLAGAGHSPMVERPQAFAEVLVRFITEDWEGYDRVRASALDRE